MSALSVDTIASSVSLFPYLKHHCHQHRQCWYQSIISPFVLLPEISSSVLSVLVLHHHHFPHSLARNTTAISISIRIAAASVPVFFHLKYCHNHHQCYQCWYYTIILLCAPLSETSLSSPSVLVLNYRPLLVLLSETSSPSPSVFVLNYHPLLVLLSETSSHSPSASMLYSLFTP